MSTEKKPLSEQAREDKPVVEDYLWKRAQKRQSDAERHRTEKDVGGMRRRKRDREEREREQETERVSNE